MDLPSSLSALLQLRMDEARRDLAADGFTEPVGADPVYGSDGRTIVGAVVLARNAAGEEGFERVLYPTLGPPPARPLLVGELNPYGADPHFALYPLPPEASGGRLQRLLGLSQTAYLRSFDRANLCTGRWSMPAARAAAAELAEREGTIVLLGAKVREAFGVELGAFEAGGRFVAIPHPSGLCRAWNEPGAVARLRRLFADRGLPVGAAE